MAAIKVNHCPACGSTLERERVIGSSYYCHCGWHYSPQRKLAEASLIRSICLNILVVALVLGAGVFHLVNWGKDAIKVLPLQLAQLTSQAQPDDLAELADLCREHKKPECIKEAYQDWLALEPTNLSVLEHLAHLHFMLDEHDKAASVYAKYFELDGKSLDAGYGYARALAELGDIEKASKYYEFVLKAKKDVLQTTVARSYVNMLIRNKRVTDAKRAIQRFRRLGVNTALFMEKELRQIRQVASTRRQG